MDYPLTAHQKANLKGIIQAVKKRGWPQKAAIIAVETALTESGMRILASANVAESLKYPHDLLSWTFDGLGHDHASVGMYQQQTGTAWAKPGTSTMGSADGWGTPAQLMDPEISTEKFLNALAKVDWKNLKAHEAAQAVQRSAFADGSNYRSQRTKAIALVTLYWPIVSATKPLKPAAAAGVQAKAVKAKVVKAKVLVTVTKDDSDGLISLCQRHGVKDWQAVAALNKLVDPYTIRVGQKLRLC